MGFPGLQARHRGDKTGHERLQHGHYTYGRLEGKAGAGAGLVEQSGKNAAIAQVGVGRGVGLHPVGKVEQCQPPV